jgi:hypothetical protein
VVAGGYRHAPAASPTGMSRYCLYRRLGGPPDLSGRVQKDSPSTGIRFPDRPAGSKSLYGLRYPGRLSYILQCKFPANRSVLCSGISDKISCVHGRLPMLSLPLHGNESETCIVLNM